jgi:hypothetical protein
MVSPEAPPMSVKPGVVTAVPYKYTPVFTVIVISDFPATYPPKVVTFREAFAALAE